MENEKINASQFTVLVTLFTLGTSILLAPGTVAVAAKNDGWIPTILGLAVGLLLVVLYNKMAKSFQQYNFLEYIDSILGPWIGKIIAFAFFIFCIFLCSLLVSQVGYFATTQFFVETPIGVIMGLFFILVIWGARYGIETLARSGELVFPWIIFLLFILLVTLIPEVKAERLFPILENGIKPILLATYSFLGLPYFELVIILFFFPNINHSKNRGKAFFVGVLFGGSIIILITLYAILILGGEGTARNQYPSLIMAKSISIGKIIERIEALLAAIWFLTIFMKSTLTLYCSSLCLAHMFKLKDPKFLIYPLGMILLFLSLFITPNVTYLQEFVIKTWTLYAGTHGVLIPILLITVAAFKKMKNRGTINAP